MLTYREISVNQDYTFSYTYYLNNIAQTPTNATAIIYNNSGEIIESITGIISGNEMSFTFTASKNITIGRNFKIVMGFTANTLLVNVQYLFDVVKVALINNVNDEDLFKVLKDIRDISRFASESTSEGTTSTIIDINLGADRRNWVGSYGEILYTDVNTENKLIKITAFDGSNTLTFTPLATSAIPIGTPYILRMSYQDQIEDAFSYVMTRIRSKVGLLAGFIDSNLINNLIIYRALYIICVAESDQENDKWDYRAKVYNAEFNSLYGNFSEAYDTDGDGSISDEENETRPDFFNIKLQR